MNNTKKISNISAIILIVGSTIGAGIFFKNKWIGRASHGELAFILGSWAVAILCIMAMGFALVELASSQKTSKGMLEWTKRFTPSWFHHSSSKYMRYVLTPITIFAIPMYIVQTLVDAGLPVYNGYLVLLIGFAILLMYIIINMTSIKVAEYSQWASKGIQLIPLIVLPLIALFMPQNGSTIVDKTLPGFDGLNGISPWVVLIAGIPAIAFSFDGFYTSASLRQDMKNPNDVGKTTFWGIFVIASFYIFVTVGFNVGSVDGTFMGLKIFKDGANEAVMAMFNVLIACGMMGVVNGYVMGGVRQLKGQMDDNEVKDVDWVYNLVINKWGMGKGKDAAGKQYVATAMFTLFSGMAYFLILGPLGTSVFSLGNGGSYGGWIDGKEGLSKAMDAGSLYTLVDTLTNFTSMIVFVIIAAAILGGLFNRKSNKVEVTKSKIFVPMAWISVISMFSALIWMFVHVITLIAGFNIQAADMGNTFAYPGLEAAFNAAVASGATLVDASAFLAGYSLAGATEAELLKMTELFTNGSANLAAEAMKLWDSSSFVKEAIAEVRLDGILQLISFFVFVGICVVPTFIEIKTGKIGADGEYVKPSSVVSKAA